MIVFKIINIQVLNYNTRFLTYLNFYINYFLYYLFKTNYHIILFLYFNFNKKFKAFLKIIDYNFLI